MISIASLIYRSPAYADAVYESLHSNTPHLHDGRARFLFVANNPTDRLLGHLERRGYPHVVERNPVLTDEVLRTMGVGPPEYIRRVYQGWNRAIRESDSEVVLVNSDMVFSPYWLEALLELAAPGNVMAVSQLVERPGDDTRAVFPSAVIADFGDHPDRFDHDSWRGWVAANRKRTCYPGGAYMPCYLRREWIDLVGYYPEGNLLDAATGKVSEYGDENLTRRLAGIGVVHVTSMDSVVYHYKEGEQRE